MDGGRRWAQDRRRKEPSLYDEYLNQERPSHKSRPSTSTTHMQTIRAVTPDPSDETLVQPKTTQTFEREFLSLTSSPATSPRIPAQEHGSPKVGSRSGIPRRESADNTRRHGTISPIPSDQYGSLRRRTMTLQGPINEHPMLPSPMAQRGTHTGSSQNTESIGLAGGGSPVMNGFQGLASSLSQPVIGSYIHRPTSSASNSVTSSVGQLPTPNARRTLYLMKTLCGRMSGNVYYRRNVDSPWIGVYCFIREAEGSLMFESEFGQGAHKILVPDLRGCQVKCTVEEDSGIPYIELVIPRSSLEVHMRVTTQSDLDSWFAALLCWQPMQPKGMHNKLAKPQAAQLSARPTTNSDSRQNSEASILREAPVIKVGQMVYWDTDVTFKGPIGPSAGNQGRSVTPRSASVGGHKSYGLRWWKRVSCTLRENGELKFFTEAENQLVSTIHLSKLSRSAIQRLDSSVLDQEYSIAIYTQYTCGSADVDSLRPIFLSVDTSILFEVWFVLLRAFTIPQLYGPKPPQLDNHDGQNNDGNYDDQLKQAHADMFRMERGLSLCVLEARLHHVERMKSSPDVAGQIARRTSSPRYQSQGGYYVEIHLDGETRGKTGIKNSDQNPFWSQEFDYYDLPAVLSSASVHLKQRTGDGFLGLKSNYESKVLSEAYGIVQEPKTSAALSGYTGITQDITIGKVEIILEELDTQKKSEQWWTILNSLEQDVGTLLIRARAQETVILMRQEYAPLHKILHAFENGLTVQIFNTIASELKRLSDSFVNIFQVSGKSTEWLMALVEDEIDGHGKDTALSKARYNQREQDNPAAPRGDRELVVRDMNKNAALEANLLFRGNTLLTKALDTHMRRIGTDYLTTALGNIIVSINDRDQECEVDPNRIANNHEMQKNWTRLLATTGDVWNSIRMSAQKCPVELRCIFRHIKACAEDKYGDFLRSVSYSSVSGFLFLRFFCPAVLSPKLFGLLKDDPKPRSKRTFVLVAKSLQTLANMATFGSKEPWMEPMNSFLNSNRESFKHFIEEVCSVPQRAAATTEISPSYSTPNAIKNRLPATSKEGFPSLPFLLDEGREYANLVELWLHASSTASFNPANEPSTSSLKQFDDICRALQARTQDCLSRAERAERPTSELSFRWEEVVDSLNSAGAASLHDTSSIPRLDTDVPSPSLLTTSFTDQLNSSNNNDEGSITPVAPSAPHLNSSTDNTANSPLSPHRRAQRDWESAPDGGASAAASVLSRDRNPRSGFVLPSTATSPGLRSPGLSGAFPSRSIADDDPISPSSTRHSPGFGWSNAAALPPPPPPLPIGQASSASSSPRLRDDLSRPTSALSGSDVGEEEGALPQVGRGKKGSKDSGGGKIRRGSQAEENGGEKRRVRDLVFGGRRDRR
ncbi:hypothetical protein K461DRAFT_291895 [Myriangium duriaei CBS 260.36]|uniref:Ras-GAP domain-containing protein n=1 Tax=Myriangium duriaei CBS 260.36 TaxID=1168546 RepID=A0A9P4MHP1_9PEZI|nr:hypothetical protein K461DRAFT_291895 [Myriangium duriaei CBS 260.36]